MNRKGEGGPTILGGGGGAMLKGHRETLIHYAEIQGTRVYSWPNKKIIILSGYSNVINYRWHKMALTCYHWLH